MRSTAILLLLVPTMAACGAGTTRRTEPMAAPGVHDGADPFVEEECGAAGTEAVWYRPPADSLHVEVRTFAPRSPAGSPTRFAQVTLQALDSATPVPGHPLTARGNSRGEIVLFVPDPGAYVLTVRAMGHRPLTDTVWIRDGDAAPVVIHMCTQYLLLGLRLWST